MKLEIESAANFLIHLINLAKKDKYEIDAFKLLDLNLNIQGVLCKKFERTWSYEEPWLGTNHRALRINENLDGRLLEASLLSDIPPEEVHSRLPKDMIIWVDPGLVKICINSFYWFDLYDLAKDLKSWTPTPPELKKQYKEDFDEMFLRHICNNCCGSDDNCTHDGI